MPKVMKSHLRQPRALEKGREGSLTEVGGVNEAANLTCKDEALILRRERVCTCRDAVLSLRS